MANAFKCDVCGALYEDNDAERAKCKGARVYSMAVYDYNDNRIKCFDLCPACSMAIGQKVQELSNVSTRKQLNPVCLKCMCYKCKKTIKECTSVDEDGYCWKSPDILQCVEPIKRCGEFEPYD